MANTDKNFDQFFKNKLSAHEEKPSQLAWEKFSSELNKKEKGIYSYYLQWAAGLLLLLGLGYLIWSSTLRDNFSNENLVIEEIKIEPTIPDINKSAQEIETNENEDIKEESVKLAEVPKKSEVTKEALKEMTPKVIEKEEKSPEMFLALDKNEFEVEAIQLPELKPVILPEIELNKEIALFDEPEISEEEPSYTVTIISKGIQDKSEKTNLIEELENKVEKIGGFLGKIEQGFADLQDAKDNLFANNSPRKERSK
jgi:hypothetical protein